ncbi:unnamed protein product [Arabidopsis lyrata]|nr:uncharacterized protein LOC9300772 isoform X1 [Arabidopsis lyrata subsp. lyrata]KAG7534966.1 hypothetical protein ISN45_Aa08g024590 [Arabidopsis thaliana x Arabidopsis arenosa]CAH8280355.1 unnamed protein product [Arabidopsis lyrata]|eukprot:XP_002866386.2 uncharacterized protein LOC9300772 isoform X1 [Arabidopsis lyrata subsp. lyrata]
MMMMMKFGFIIVALLVVTGEISTEEVSPAIEPEPSSSLPQSETEMPPSLSSPSDSEMSPSPTMSDDNDYPSSSQFTDSSDLNYLDSTRTGGGENGGGGKKTGIVVGAISAASMVGFSGYLLKKRRENIRRSRYGYASTEFF